MYLITALIISKYFPEHTNCIFHAYQVHLFPWKQFIYVVCVAKSAFCSLLFPCCCCINLDSKNFAKLTDLKKPWTDTIKKG